MKTPAARSLRLVVALLTIAVLIVGALCAYQWVTYLFKEQSRAALQRDLADTRETARQASAFRAKSEKLEGMIRQTEAGWSWSRQLPPMMAQVSKLAEESRIEVQAMQPGSVVERGELVRFPLRFSFEGGLRDVVGFLQEAQEAEPLLVVDRLSIRTGASADDPLRVETTLSSYVVRPVAEVRGEQP
jgi:Tfp pilus assembly protein PilO